MKKSIGLIQIILVFNVVILSCKKDGAAGESLPPERTKVFFTLDTTVSLQKNGGEPRDAWEAWDYPQTTTGKDSLFGAWLQQLQPGYFYDVGDISSVSFLMSNGDWLDSIPVLRPDTAYPRPFSFSCICENGTTPNLIGLTWVQPEPSTRPEIDSVKISVNYWIWK